MKRVSCSILDVLVGRQSREESDAEDLGVLDFELRPGFAAGSALGEPLAVCFDSQDCRLRKRRFVPGND